MLCERRAAADLALDTVLPTLAFALSYEAEELAQVVVIQCPSAA